MRAPDWMIDILKKQLRLEDIPGLLDYAKVTQLQQFALIEHGKAYKFAYFESPKKASKFFYKKFSSLNYFLIRPYEGELVFTISNNKCMMTGVLSKTGLVIHTFNDDTFPFNIDGSRHRSLEEIKVDLKKALQEFVKTLFDS